MDDFKWRLTDLVYKHYPKVDFRLMFIPPTSISNLFSFKDKSALYKHSIDHDHSIDYDNVEILDKASSDK